MGRKLGPTLKSKPPGRPRSVRTPENIKAVRQIITQSPQRSALRHAAAMEISDPTLDSNNSRYSMMLLESAGLSTMKNSASEKVDTIGRRNNMAMNDWVIAEGDNRQEEDDNTEHDDTSEDDNNEDDNDNNKEDGDDNNENGNSDKDNENNEYDDDNNKEEDDHEFIEDNGADF
ncbi:hypothetical protein ANN_01389 [Periplaneta americana]|uniref:Uncharacterized protein n=1 Tax=Periplaneta americana TaxID=6978 RepID=A0ABQ8TTE7_PERAM|nr:hypothetical protein ANN_01389 [Periplaneta americana]